jgi:hypothetical protein
MKTCLHGIAMILLVLLSCVSNSCAGPAKPAAVEQPPAIMPSAPEEPVAGSADSHTVLDMVQRLNNGDVDGSLKYFAEDAVIYFVGMPPTGMEIYKGREVLRPTWQDCANSHFKWEVKITSSGGGMVMATTKTWHDFTRQLGVAPNEFLDIFVLKDGQITEYASTLTEASLAKFKPALAEVIPPAEPPTPSQEKPGSKMKFTTVGGSCTYEGPMVLQEGNVKVGWDVKDTNKQKYALTFHTLAAGKDRVDLMASTVESAPPSWASMLLYAEQRSGSSGSYQLSAKEGPIYVVCWSGAPDMAIGLVGPFGVVSSAAPTPTP